jgi:hypothetical protein
LSCIFHFSLHSVLSNCQCLAFNGSSWKGWWFFFLLTRAKNILIFLWIVKENNFSYRYRPAR